MNRNLLAGLLLATALVAPALAADAPTVKSIDVTVDIAAVKNPQAAAYWGTLETDLEGAILARLPDQISDDGVDVNIDIEEVSLSNGFQEAVGLADTRLVGKVNASHATDNSRFVTYDLTVDVNAAKSLMPADFDPATAGADTRVYYTMMVNAFADGVVERLK